MAIDIIARALAASTEATEIAAIIARLDKQDKKISGIEERVATLEKAEYEIPAATKESLGGVKFDDTTLKLNDNQQLYVADVSTDVLSQGELTLVLNGGDANII